jgi:hypothetical protein
MKASMHNPFKPTTCGLCFLTVQPLLYAQLTAAAGSDANRQQQQQQQQPLISPVQLSTALLAAVALLPDISEDLPLAPNLLAELIGHFMAAGELFKAAL